MGLGVIELVTWAAVLGSANSNYPVFDINSQMQNLLLPADARIGSIIYRLRATDSDRDYPLVFAATDYGSYVIRIENLPCNRNSSYCEANVFLERTLAPNQVFKFRMTVRDTKGDTTTVPVSIKVTNGVTDFNEVFPHVPGVVMIPEDTKIGTELEYVIVKKHPRAVRQAVLELRGSSEFKFDQTSKQGTTTGVISLAEKLDYEEKTMYRLSIYATGMWVDMATDSRNVAGFQLVVIVTDVQDTPPVFDPIEPITAIDPNLKEGDTVLRVTARDGDRGTPRAIRYGLLAEGNPYTVFFSIDQDTGDIRLVRPLSELAIISRTHHPILVTVMAEEIVPSGKKENSTMTTATATVALLLGQLDNTPPYFESPNYVAYVAENSPQGFALVFGDPYVTEVKDNDMGKRGIFSLSLLNNNGTFEITPTIGEREATFVIRVRDNRMLDYETNKELSFKIVAKEVNPEQESLSTIVNVVVYITDVNDNPPVFLLSEYTATAAENVTAGVMLAKFECTDLDSGDAGLVKFTAAMGPKNGSLKLDRDTGALTVVLDDHGFDREESSSYHFSIEARDMKGTGNRAIVPFTLIVLDVNDNAPVFERSTMEFMLGQDGTNFSQKAFIKASDADAEQPNNIVRYEIISGNYGSRYILKAETGELLVNPRGRSRRQSKEAVNELSVRAYDLGVPTMFSTGTVKIFPAESGARLMTFVVPGSNLHPRTVHQLLTELTGARVVIHSVEKYYGHPQYHQRPGIGNDSMDRYIVTATVLYENDGAVIDLETLQNRLADRTYAYATIRPQAENKPSDSVVVYRTESDAVFWILLALLLLLLLALLLLLFCCLCECCPCYGVYNRLVRRKSAVQTTNGVNYMNNALQHERENKSVQAEWLRSSRRDAWSAEPPRGQWHFNRRNSERRLLLVAERAPPPPAQPNIVYTKEMGERIPMDQQRRANELIVEDVDGTEYRLLDPSRLSIRRSQADTLSIQRPASRASDVHQQQNAVRPAENQPDGTRGRPPTRDEEFIRDGNAEILRLVTRGRENGDEDEEPTINQPERPYTHEEGEGKDVIMKKFIEDAQEEHNATKHNPDDDEEEVMRRAMTMREKDLTTADINRLTSLQRDLLLTRFLVQENRRTRNNSIGDETQSLPGVTAMATQTDSHAGTQTEKVYFSKRRTKSDNDDSLSDSEESAKRRFKRGVRSRMRVETAVEAFQVRPKEIKTPIMEEPEASEGISHSIKNGAFTETKASLLRHAAARNKLGVDDSEKSEERASNSLVKAKSMSEHDISFISKHRDEVVRSLQATPIKRVNIASNVLVEQVSHDELNPPHHTGHHLTYSHPPAPRKPRVGSVPSKQLAKSVPIKRQSSSDPSRSRQSSKENSSLDRETAPRYMEWYNKKPTTREAETREKSEQEPRSNTIQRRKPVVKQTRQKKVTNTTAPSGVDVDEEVAIPARETADSRTTLTEPLVEDLRLQSRGRERDRKYDEDGDSGIAVHYTAAPQIANLRHQQAMEKKSIFTIAYDDMETRKIRLDTASP